MSRLSINTILQKIEELHNRASDTNFVWFPFLNLKLLPNQIMNFKHRILMTLVFGPYFAIFYFLRVWLFDELKSFDWMVLSLVKITLFFFIWFNLVTAYFWNRRVRRLNGGYYVV